ncbi:MAG: SulP family inorganic anion transporter [Burkholderiales bacterium]|nr:SulP family inorganic anion transporter [Burkholderiales bacterium]
MSLSSFLLPKDANPKAEILSGVTVAFALIPEAIAFALVASVSPIVGLYGAFFMCLISALFGGRPGMISGATGSMAVVMVSVVQKFGIDYLFATIVLTGVIQILFGVFKFGKFIRLMPKPVMIGFVNGLAIVIFLAQLGQFKIIDESGHQTWLHGTQLYIMIALVLVTMLITHYLPKISKAAPSALVAIIIIALITNLTHMDVRTVSNMLLDPNQAIGLPIFSIPTVPLTFNTLLTILPYGFILAFIGISESLMTLTLIDEITKTHGRANKECIAQGAGNIVSGFFKAMGGCAMIGQSMINITSGAKGRLSGIVAAITLLVFMLISWSYIKMIPLAALVGVMFIVVIGTFEWTSLRLIKRSKKSDLFIIVMVTLVTIFTDLAIAVICGFIIAALVFAWETSKHIYAERTMGNHSSEIYKIHGILFFGSTHEFKNIFDYVTTTKQIVIDFKHSRVADHSAIDAIASVAKDFIQVGKTVTLIHLSEECKTLLGKAGDLVQIDINEDPDYHIATDKLD